MGLFNKKELKDYKVLEKYKGSLDGFDFIGETEKYLLFLDRENHNYVVRQEKQNPKNVVMLGEVDGEVHVFHNRIYSISYSSYAGETTNPLNCIDIDTGKAGRASPLSTRRCRRANHWFCQDFVKSFTIQDDKMVLEVDRYKEDVHDEMECSYVIYITDDNGRLKINRVFPDDYVEPEEQEETDYSDSNLTEFERDLKNLLARDDIQSRQDICEAEYKKALGILKNPSEKYVHRAYDLMGNLASQFDYVPAIMWMGDFMEHVFRDLSQAAFWYKKAADLGDGNGARCYADMLITGNGIEKNTQMAKRYYIQAANKGVPEAAFVLGEFFRNAGDRENALKAYQHAYNGGYAPAKIRIDQMNNGER